jgi:hypothetical protein
MGDRDKNFEDPMPTTQVIRETKYHLLGFYLITLYLVDTCLDTVKLLVLKNFFMGSKGHGLIGYSLIFNQQWHFVMVGFYLYLFLGPVYWQ